MIEFSKITWHEVSDKVDTQPIEEALKTIQLSDYGNGVEHIYFNFIAVKPTNTVHENEANYDREKKTIEMSLKLSFDRVQNSNKAHVLKMMASLFLVSIDLYERFEIKGFDHSILKGDCEKLFRSKRWLRR